MGDRLHPRLIFSNYKYITVDRCVLLWASSNEHLHGNRLRGACISFTKLLNGCCKC